VATFDYTARNQRGEMTIGHVESPNSQAVAAWMATANLVPINITQRPADSTDPKWFRDLMGEKKVTETELLLFTRQMSSLIKAGIPMMQALVGIQKSSVKEHLIKLLQALRDDLDKGVELSGALAKHPVVFSEFYVNMVKMGETSGKIDAIFRRLHEHLDFDSRMRRQLKSALRYPTFVTIALGIAMGIINIYVIPVFAEVYGSLKMDLPILTKVLVGVSDFSVKYWWGILLGLGLAYYAFRLYYKTPDGRLKVDRFKLRIPIFGKLIAKTTMARYSFAFSTASESGVPLVQIYDLAAKVADNAYYEQRILLMRDAVERGETIHRAAQLSGIFSPLELQMISVGEDSAQVDQMLKEVAKMYQEELEFEVSRLAETIEPIIIAFMGVMVAILMLGIFLPIWNMTALTKMG
jgi:MSHA biogenesis protein MshG